MRLWLLLLLVGGAPPLQEPPKVRDSTPQETPVPEPEKLLIELRQKFEAARSVSGKVTIEAVDSKGENSLLYKASFHIRPSDGWLYAEMQELTKDEGPGFMLYEVDRPAHHWRSGKPGSRIHTNETFREFWNHGWYFIQEKRKVLEGPEPAKNLDEHIAGMKTAVELEMKPSKPGAAEPASFRIAVGRSTKGGASWLKAVPEGCRVTATPDDVIVRESAPARISVIDRKTGMLRSVRIDFPGMDSRVLSVTGITLDQPKPEVRLPERWTDRPARVVDALSMISPMLRAEAVGSFDDLLKDWERVGVESRAELLRDYFAWFGGERDKINRGLSRANWAKVFVQKSVEMGASLDELNRDFDTQAKRFESAVLAAEMKSDAKKTLMDHLIQFREELEKAAAEAPGSEEARKLLIRRIQEGFAPDRLLKARTSRPETPLSKFLRDALDAAREKEAD